MRKKLIPIVLLILLSLLSGCGAQTGERAEFDSYLTALDEKRRDNLTWSSQEQADFAVYAPDFSDQAGAFSSEELTMLMTPREPADVSGLQAQEDVETFFRLLETTYGGYVYFGGDEVFHPVRDAMLSELKEKITSEELNELFHRSLSDLIIDGHFIIGSYYGTMDTDQFMYYVPDLYFDNTDGIDPAYISPTIGPKGQLTYCFAALSHDGTNLPATAEVSGRQRRLNWKRAEAYEPEEGEDRLGYRKTSVSDIPVLESRILYAKEGENETLSQLEALAGAGSEYRGLPLVIVDLRHNGGGDSSYASGWVEGFTGQRPVPKVAYFEKCSEPYLKTLAVNPAYANVSSDWKSDYYRMKGEWNWGSQDGILLDNDTIVFLLADKETGSSGEDFVRYLSTADHVIRVGTNTAGVLQFGNVCEFYLPNSGLFLRMGSKLAFYDSTQLSEGIGVLPDLWVNPPDALDAVVRMCGFYGLKQP